MRVAIKRVALGDLDPNPYRDMKTYELGEARVERLIQSYRESGGFWDGSIHVRPHPDKQGRYQLAFGHHRKEAAKRSGMKDLGVVVGKRSDAMMLKMLASENAEEFKNSPLVTQETLGAVIKAYGRGEIELEKVPALGGKGGKPSGVYSAENKPYTCLTVARFLGWTKAGGTQANHACRVAFDAWHEKARSGVDIQELLRKVPAERRTSLASDALVAAVRSADRQAQRSHLSKKEATAARKSAAVAIVKLFVDDTPSRDIEDQAGKVGTQEARSVAKAAGKAKKVPPTIEHYSKKIIGRCNKSTGRYSDILDECRQLVPFLSDLDGGVAEDVAEALVEMLKRDALGVQTVAKALRSPRKVDVIRKLIEEAK